MEILGKVFWLLDRYWIVGAEKESREASEKRIATAQRKCGWFRVGAGLEAHLLPLPWW